MAFVVLGIMLFFSIAVFLAIVIVANQASAKKEAKKILAEGKIKNRGNLKRVMRILSNAKDTEATYLWHKLQEMQEKLSRNSHNLSDSL